MRQQENSNDPSNTVTTDSSFTPVISQRAERLLGAASAAETNKPIAPGKFLFESLRFLVCISIFQGRAGKEKKRKCRRRDDQRHSPLLSQILQIESKPPSRSSPEALALLDVVKLVESFPWEPSLRESVVHVLQTHPALSDKASELLQRLQPPKSSPTMPSAPLDVAALAQRMPDNLVQALAEVGPSCTSNVDTLRKVLREFGLSSLAHFVYFMAVAASSSDDGLSSALLGSLLPGSAGGASGWNLPVVAQVLQEDYRHEHWGALNFDFPAFALTDTSQFGRLVELFRAGAGRPPPLDLFVGEWKNSSGQLSVLECLLVVPPAVYVVPLTQEEQGDATVGTETSKAWASSAVVQRLLALSDVPALYRRVRELFVNSLLSCPEILLCAMVRLQIRMASAQDQAAANAGVSLKTDVMRELIPLFFRPNHPQQARVKNGAAALRHLYVMSPNIVTAACFEAWRSSDGSASRYATIMHIINIARLLPSPTEAVASLLNGSKDIEFSIAVAFVMCDNDYLQLKPWLAEKLNKTLAFSLALISYLRKHHATAAPRSDKPLVSVENIVTSLQLLRGLDASIRNSPADSSSTIGDNINMLLEAVVAAYPSLRSQFSSKPGSSSGSPSSSSPVSDEVDEMATRYFQKIYTSEQSIGEVVEMLKRFKSSGNSKENEIFACMVHNLFDEYRYFYKYPEKELRITGILFGALIQEQLVNSITLGIALRYVLEALRKPPSQPGSSNSSGKMFKFGMYALEQFKGRLHEWPQYCSHIVQIPHLKEGYADLVAEIEREMAMNPGRGASGQSPGSGGVTSPRTGAFALSSGGAPQPPGQAPPHRSLSAPVTASDLEQVTPEPDTPPRVAEFGPMLGRAVSDSADDDSFEAPPDSVLDRVQFLINNLAPTNVDQKAQDLKDILEPQYFGWLGHFLVVKRISTQENYHSLYLSFLDSLGDYGTGLVEAILSSVYRNIGKLLRSSTITTSTSERKYLKNLGIWLGLITLSRNRPILQIMLDCKELLLQGYETGKLIAVAPFLAKTLEGAKNSKIFRPPNPWVMGILGVFRAVYMVDGLKMNIKFEVEVLCKNLNIRLEDIPLRGDVLARRIAPVKERNPDFNVKSSSAGSSMSRSTSSVGVSRPSVANESKASGQMGPEDGGRLSRQGQEQQDTVIPNLAAYVTINAGLSQILSSQGSPALSSLTISSFKRWVPLAVDRAIREIIQPVVERSVTIACITTKEVVLKDFAMESDEAKVRKAGQLMVANLAGSLALVTCRDPLRTSVSTHLRQLLTNHVSRGSEKLSDADSSVIEQCVQMCATDNLELGCMLIEKAATEKGVRDVDEALSNAVSARRNHREQTGQPYYDMSIFSQSHQRYPGALPDRLRPKPGCLQPEHFVLYESFQRTNRQALGSAGVSSSGRSSRQTATSSTPDGEVGAPMKTSPGQPFSAESLTALATKLDSAVTSLLSAAGNRAAEVKFSMLPQDHVIRQLLGAIKQVMPNAGSTPGATRPLTTSEQEVVLGFSQGVFKRLYELNLTEPLRLEALVALLERINSYCPKLGKDMGTWSTYAPTNTEPQRRLHRTVLLLLVRSRLLAVHELDGFLAARADSGRNHIWVEFSLLFIRTALTEQIATTGDFPKLLDLMTRIADGRSQASAQMVETYRQPILRMLEETRVAPHSEPVITPPATNITVGASAVKDNESFEQSSSLSPVTLSTYGKATRAVAESTELFARRDPASARQQVASLLEAWIRLQSDEQVSEKSLAQYMQVLQTFGVGKSEEQTERFFRLAAITVVEAVLKNPTVGTDGRKVLNYTFVDLYCKLLVILVHHMNSGGTQEQIHAQRLGVLNKILGSTVRSMMWQYEKHKLNAAAGPWDQRPWYRLFMNLVMDLNQTDKTLEPIRLGILSVFAAAFHVCQPLVFPAFAFAWFELVAHRHFLPNLLIASSQRGWPIAHQLLVDQLLFLEPSLRHAKLSKALRKMYEGTLRVMLVLLHDYPSFLASYHVSFCNVIPDTCVQLRNIILAATPKGITAPDPFTPNLKIDLLPEISQAPAIMSAVLSPIDGFRVPLDAFLKEGAQRQLFLSNLAQLLCVDGTNDVDSAKIQSLVIYVGAHALTRIQSAQISLSRTPEIEVLLALMELDDRGRYLCLSAMANQLRYPSSHTHYFSCVMLYLFSESKNVAVKEQVTRVLLERVIASRHHPWGLLITFMELIKNQRYAFWSYPFTRCATEIEKVFESVARSFMPPGTQRAALVSDEQ